MTSFSGRFEQGEQYIDHISGYFKAPVDGEYTFYAYGDDATILIFDGSNSLSTSTYWDSFGNVFANTPTGSVTLTAGETKKILLKHSEGSGGDFSRVGVKIVPTTPIASHPEKKLPSVFTLSITQTPLVKQIAEVILNPISGLDDSLSNGGTYKLSIISPKF